MSRSTADATRFTATGPYAYSKSSMAASPAPSKWSGLKVRSSQPSQPSPGQDGVQETAKEKVERLRAQARANRISKSFSPMDRLVNSGRTWADRFHRIAVFSLITASGVAGILTIYSIGSLFLHNRRQRELFVERELNSLLDARKAYVAGTASTAQIELLRKEKIAEEEKRAREELKKQTMFYKARSWLFDGPAAVQATPQLQTPEIPGSALESRPESSQPAPTTSSTPSSPPPSSSTTSSWTSWASWGGSGK